MAEFPHMSSSEIKSAKQAEGDLLAHGANVDERGRLIASATQIEDATKEMNVALVARELAKHFSANTMRLLSKSLELTYTEDNEHNWLGATIAEAKELRCVLTAAAELLDRGSKQDSTVKKNGI